MPALAVAGLAALSACVSTPVTGRSAFNIFSTSQDVELGREAYEEILKGEPIVTSGPEKAMVERAMQRLVGVADNTDRYEWEVTLIEKDVANAFALPGGKMAVYTGILAVCGDETGLAVVMGHEIGHVVARHGTERVSRRMPIQIMLELLDAEDYQAIAEASAAVLLELPFSRQHESEADHIGLMYMARAGYDPRESIAFWERMAQGGGGAPPEFLSTHPSHGTRVRQLQDLMPEALDVWRAAGP